MTAKYSNLLSLLITVVIITFLHEIGHLIGYYLSGDFHAYLIVVKGLGILPLVPCFRATSWQSINIFSCLLVPITLQYLFVYKKGRSRWWIPYILWGHRFDFLKWIVSGCLIFPKSL